MTIFVENHEGKMIPIDDTRPVYRVLDPAGFFGPNDHLYPENYIIYYDGEPSEQFEALTPPAYERLSAYIAKQDEEGRRVAEKLGKAFVGRPRSPDGAYQLATAIQKAEMGIFGAKKNDVSVESADPVKTPEVGTAQPKRGPGRPKKGENSSIQAA